MLISELFEKYASLCLTLIKMALCAPWCRMAKKKECPCSTSSPADPKIESEDTKKMSKSQQLIDTRNALFTTFTFWFHFLDLLIKFMKMRLLYILYCPPTPATWRQGHFYTFAILHRPICRSLPPHPAFLLAGTAAHYAVTFLAAGGRGWRLILHHYM